MKPFGCITPDGGLYLDPVQRAWFEAVCKRLRVYEGREFGHPPAMFRPEVREHAAEAASLRAIDTALRAARECALVTVQPEAHRDHPLHIARVAIIAGGVPKLPPGVVL